MAAADPRSNNEQNGGNMIAFRNAIAEAVTCSICLEVFRAPVIGIAPCNHKFCQSCVTQWLQRCYKCPECRGPISSTNQDFLLNKFVDLFYTMNPDIGRPPRVEYIPIPAPLNVRILHNNQAFPRLPNIEQPFFPFPGQNLSIQQGPDFVVVNLPLTNDQPRNQRDGQQRANAISIRIRANPLQVSITGVLPPAVPPPPPPILPHPLPVPMMFNPFLFNPILNPVFVPPVPELPPPLPQQVPLVEEQANDEDVVFITMLQGNNHQRSRNQNVGQTAHPPVAVMNPQPVQEQTAEEPQQMEEREAVAQESVPRNRKRRGTDQEVGQFPPRLTRRQRRLAEENGWRFDSENNAIPPVQN